MANKWWQNYPINFDSTHILFLIGQINSTHALYLNKLLHSHFLLVSGAVGQSDWAEFFPDCGGSSQSPINVDMSHTVHDPTLLPVEPLGYNQPGNKPFTLLNNGQTGKSYTHINFVKYKQSICDLSTLQQDLQRGWNNHLTSQIYYNVH